MKDMLNKKRGQILRDPMPYGKVLVVDDVETNLYVAEGLMKSYRLTVDTVMSGYEAIDKIKTGIKYDVVFMDHMMPGMDGIEAVKHLRDMGYTEPVVALTANAVAGQADVFLNSGFDDFLSKPIDIRRLNSVLNKLVRDKQPPEVIEELQKLLEKISLSKDEDGTDSNIELLREQLLSVQKACEDYNRKDALELLDKIKQKSCSKETREVLDRVTEHVLHSEFEEAEQIIAVYADRSLSGG